MMALVVVMGFVVVVVVVVVVNGFDILAPGAVVNIAAVVAVVEIDVDIVVDAEEVGDDADNDDSEKDDMKKIKQGCFKTAPRFIVCLMLLYIIPVPGK